MKALTDAFHRRLLRVEDRLHEEFVLANRARRGWFTQWGAVRSSRAAARTRALDCGPPLWRLP